MSTSHTILASLPSFCPKLSKLVEIWRSSDKNKFAQFFWDTVYTRKDREKEGFDMRVKQTYTQKRPTRLAADKQSICHLAMGAIHDFHDTSLSFRCIHAWFTHPYHTPPLFQVELENDGWDYVDMVRCQGAQNIGLSYHKITSAFKCTVWSQYTPVPLPGRQTDEQTDEHHGNSAMIRSNERIAR